ncbi:MAG: PBP1A family penicillin-binding protein [bacterium]
MHKSSQKGNVLVAMVIIIAFLLASMAAAAFYFNSLPPISQLKNYQPTFMSEIVSSDGKVIKTFGALKYKKTTIDEIPVNLKEAIIATEDKNFYHHIGFDPLALVRSTLSNLRAGHVVQGASTITQQLARILFLSTEKTMDRKVKELIIAYRLEKSLPKDKILEMYLNNVYLGEGAYGVASASDIYFNKSAEKLNLAECALIAGLPQAPSVYSPFQNMDLAKQRRHQVLERMVKMNFITEAQAEEANNAPVHLSQNHRPSAINRAPYFADYAMKELRDEIGITEQEIIQGGYKIFTTLDYKAQLEAQKSIRDNLSKWGLTRHSDEASFVSLDSATGKILAYLGGKDYDISQYDRASQSIRQPGSAFKVLVYITAIERGLKPDSLYDDRPLTIGNWSPHNYSHRYRGKIKLSDALAFSSNVVAVRLITDLGVDSVISMARRLGLTTPIATDPTIALGSSGVKNIEMTTAYGVLANGGIRVKPHAIERIETANGQVIYEASNVGERVLSPETVSQVVQMMKGVMKKGTARSANLGRPCAGKTGTTDSYKDAWFIGFTPEVVTGVWVGNDNNAQHHGLTGGTAPAAIWKEYMTSVMANKPVTDFTNPGVPITANNKVQQDTSMQDLQNFENSNPAESVPANSVNPETVDVNNADVNENYNNNSSQGSSAPVPQARPQQTKTIQQPKVQYNQPSTTVGPPVPESTDNSEN